MLQDASGIVRWVAVERGKDRERGRTLGARLVRGGGGGEGGGGGFGPKHHKSYAVHWFIGYPARV